MTNPAATDYHDRRTGLILFGIFEILMGGFCALMILFMMFAQAMGNRAGTPPRNVAHAMMIYAVAGVAFIWLGIGSISARRWARALLACLSGMALCGGLIGGACLAFMLPHLNRIMALNQAALPPGTLHIVEIIMTVVVLVINIIIPGVLFLFYRSPHVKRTCEVRDPVERWTDRCPLAALAYSLLMGFGGIFALGLLVNFHVFPVFGIFATGAAGYAVTVLAAGVLLYLAWGLYRLQVAAWWIALGMQLISAISGVVTFWRPDVTELYLKMGLDHRAAAAVGDMFSVPAFTWMIPISILPWLVWLLCIRRYFIAPPALPPLPKSEMA
jgi:hypothetical protein